MSDKYTPQVGDTVSVALEVICVDSDSIMVKVPGWNGYYNSLLRVPYSKVSINPVSTPEEHAYFSAVKKGDAVYDIEAGYGVISVLFADDRGFVIGVKFGDGNMEYFYDVEGGDLNRIKGKQNLFYADDQNGPQYKTKLNREQ